MERSTAESGDRIPNAGTLVEITDAMPRDAREHLQTFAASEDGRYMLYAALMSKGEWFVFVGAPSEDWKKFNPNAFPYTDGPFKSVVKVPVVSVVAESAKILPFRKRGE